MIIKWFKFPSTPEVVYLARINFESDDDFEKFMTLNAHLEAYLLYPDD